MNLTDAGNFSLHEAEFSSTAIRKGINNVIPAGLMPNVRTAANGMETIRALLNGFPINVDSWYRCPHLNSSVGGSKTSAHMKGFAVDFVCPYFGTPLEICKAIAASNLEYDQLIQEGGKNGWVHISFSPEKRMIILSATFDVHGRPTYTNGIT